MKISRVLEDFREFIDIMTQEASMELPKHSPYDRTMDLREGAAPPWRPIYSLNRTDLGELRKWVEKMTEMGAI